MKTTIKIALLLAAFLFSGTMIQAQEKKKSQDTAYINSKKRMDEQRNREAEEKRKNDSLRKVRRADSMNEVRRADSMRYVRPMPGDTINPPDKNRRDSAQKGVPPRMDKGAPPKGPNPANKEE
ncbi:MAG TPA: hypothetical protein VK826_18125 [Bacteroidia bacterium]|nr:hypothetical protein [Bacteroidia bacterium]